MRCWISGQVIVNRNRDDRIRSTHHASSGDISERQKQREKQKQREERQWVVAQFETLMLALYRPGVNLSVENQGVGDSSTNSAECYDVNSEFKFFVIFLKRKVPKPKDFFVFRILKRSERNYCCIIFIRCWYFLSK